VIRLYRQISLKTEKTQWTLIIDYIEQSISNKVRVVEHFLQRDNGKIPDYGRTTPAGCFTDVDCCCCVGPTNFERFGNLFEHSNE
jgi:hypothetical protein